jgi:hypothetical protein
MKSKVEIFLFVVIVKLIYPDNAYSVNSLKYKHFKPKNNNKYCKKEKIKMRHLWKGGSIIFIFYKLIISVKF